MHKFFYILLFICTLSNQIFTDQVYGLKGSYDIQVNLEGSDKASINKGMKQALKSLIVKVSGSSVTLDNLEANNLFKDPQKYISEYRLENSKEGVLKGSFSFSGSLIRKALMENTLPLWIGQSSTILVYLPCLEEIDSSLSIDIISDSSCLNSKKQIKDISSSRLSSVVFPSMDLIDLNLLEVLQPLSSSVFMTRITKRYDLTNWLICFNRDDFGILVERPFCTSSFNKKVDSIENILNKLIDFINFESQLLINNKVEAIIPVTIKNVVDQEDLEEVLENINKNILVKNLDLKTIENDDIKLLVKILGSKLAFKKIMIASEKFDHLLDDKDKITLNFIYKRRI